MAPGANAATVIEDGDAAGDLSTDAVMEFGDVFEGSINPAGDDDWVAIDLDGGQTVAITLDATFFGGVIEVYDSDGNLIDSATAGFGSDPELVLDVPASGTYYISVSQNNGSRTGDYVLAVGEYVPPSPLDAIDWGGVSVDTGGTNNIKVYFALAGETFDGITAEGLNAYEQGQFIEAFNRISAVADVTFEIVTSSADANLFLVGDNGQETSGFYGYFNPPGERNEGVGVFNMGLWDRNPGGDLEAGGWGFVTIIHELGHGLGMAHPHDTGGGSPVMDGVSSSFGDYGDFDLNQGVYTMMSYNSGAEAYAPMPPESIWGYEMGPMAFDIAMLQEKYGVNTTTNSGDNVYAMTDLQGSGQGFIGIWDTGGTDEIVNTSGSSSIIFLLDATLQYEEGGGGYISNTFDSNRDPIAGGYTIAAGVVIENATGSGQTDGLIGNEFDNVLTGHGGIDYLIGFEGDDILDGGDGADWMWSGVGSDIMIGGAGADLFEFRRTKESGTVEGDRDIIQDFEVGLDRIMLTFMDGDAATDGNQSMMYIGGLDFSGTGIGEVRVLMEAGWTYNLAFVDLDGDANADMAFEIHTTDMVTESDFLL
ncbi:M10 family metallopeptidase C-terminal domain-containing protein [Ponticoccus sp. SC2-23]|uniref:M10 family metallopeptidase C-terminal domain-containing protein n=1 Tax=Alexandriicola marinus TaxID=2081710 RepID=UPI0013DEAFB5|nr:M10 family metallopeptidase C-terminal domain-containing protein [Alexandriicola marinus]MBM1222092.1 M10 family metallopeptidase C-terminal domain-containing protein [Ponticoccus sp. SC6-9]MBM1226779.1 M10 family metallopeptidase C-terminal domain-containing protein [Ponticoccus sp. SC6-15]MBM1231039.1 M10 family metallopeptidase C-terminal domain-containing protein [Ponticoccus sp. SC6-38]MBM1235709.1 M10 family metallopeptidase C-terminal domain-containing protein [Ponticoccus sp. SC6-45]